MSDIIVFARRSSSTRWRLAARVSRLAAYLHGEPLLGREHLVVDEGWAVVAALSASSATLRRGASFCAGALRHSDCDWWTPGAKAPDGTYALVRANHDVVECLTDYTGSRAIWFYSDADRFIASTSERAVIALLESFEPNENAIPWLLSAGNAGAGNAWDRRICMLAPNRRLVLNRGRWQVSERPAFRESEFANGKRPEDSELLKDLRQILADMRVASPAWALSLSGGCDSRAILATLPRASWTTISWGSEATRGQPGFDLYIADRLASRYSTHHHTLPLALGADVERMLTDFVAHSEGRSDHLSGYIDDFGIWRQIVDLGIDGVMRGDELFGSDMAGTQALSWANMGLATFGDYATTRQTRALSRLFGQTRHAGLQQRAEESQPAWRDRLRREFEQPVVLATLNQVRSRYVEMANPLLFRALASAARGWSDHQTVNKAYFKSAVEGLVPDLPFASRPSIMSRDQLYADARFRELLMDHTDSVGCRALLPTSIRASVVSELARSEATAWRAMRKITNRLRRSISLREGHFSIRGARPVFDIRDLALRSFIVEQAQRLLHADAQFGVNSRKDTYSNPVQNDEPFVESTVRAAAMAN